MPRPCLITYDIANPKRLGRLHRGLKKCAMAIQYSVFHAELTDGGLAEVIALIEQTIDPRTDDVRIYMLPKDGWAVALGRQILPIGIMLTSLPMTYRPLMTLHDLDDHAHVEGIASSHEALFNFEARADDLSLKARLTRRRRQLAKEIQAKVQTGDRRGLHLVH